MDVSSELIHSLLPVFMYTALGVSAFAIGMIEGAAEATALIVKVFSGAISDYWGKRKPLALLGYGLGAASKPLFALATSAGFVLATRLMDRVGKGIRGAAFGLRQALDTAGAFLSPLLAMGLMLLWANDFRAVFWVAVIPAFLAVALLFFGVREPERSNGNRVNPIRRENLRRLPGSYWAVVGIGAAFALARFSEAFLVLRAEQGGVASRLHAAGADRHECGVRRQRLPLRQTVGFGEPSQVAGLGAGGADRGRCGSCIQQPLELGVGGHHPVGPAHGHDPRAAGGDGGRCCPRRPARHGLRLFQSGERNRAVGCQRAGRVAVGLAGGFLYLRCRGRLLRSGFGCAGIFHVKSKAGKHRTSRNQIIVVPYCLQECKREPQPPFWIELNLNYAALFFLRRAVNPSKPKPASSMA